MTCFPPVGSTPARCLRDGQTRPDPTSPSSAVSCVRPVPVRKGPWCAPLRPSCKPMRPWDFANLFRKSPEHLPVEAIMPSARGSFFPGQEGALRVWGFLGTFLGTWAEGDASLVRSRAFSIHSEVRPSLSSRSFWPDGPCFH